MKETTVAIIYGLLFMFVGVPTIILAFSFWGWLIDVFLF